VAAAARRRIEVKDGRIEVGDRRIEVGDGRIGGDPGAR